MNLEAGRSAGTFDAIVVGGGHNGLVATAYLARAGKRVLLLEARDILGGPCGTYEFMPGYRSAITNSPGSFEPRFIAELELEKFGLRFYRTDPTVLHPFPNGTFVGWRDRQRIVDQLNGWAAGEADRYFWLLADLEELGKHLGASTFRPSPDISEMAKNLPASQRDMFDRVMLGSLRQLLDERLKSEETKALLGMIALNAALTPPSAPGSAVGLMMRPISLASYDTLDADDPRRTALRGSTGLPIGGMGAMIESIAAFCRHHGAQIETGARVAKILHVNGEASGVVTEAGNEYRADTIISALNPKTLFSNMLDDDAVGGDLRNAMSALPMRGSAFKLVLALDRLPIYAGLPEGVSQADAASVQFRLAPSIDYIEKAVADGLSGRLSEKPIMWGLIPSVTSPKLAPEGHHLLSVNIWHAPYTLLDGHSWPQAGECFVETCIDVLSGYMPNLRDCIVGNAHLDPVMLESELGLVQSNITHGDMLPGALFGARPHRAAHDYRTPLKGLYLSGAGTWPGGYVTGIPGFNAANAVLEDLSQGR